MANLPETSSFDSVYQFETTDPIQGGPDGVDNLPHKQLTNRTRWLYDNKLSLSGGTMTGKLAIGLPGAGDGLVIGTPSGADAVIRLTQADQTTAAIKAAGAGAITFGVDNSLGDTERMRIDSNGNMLIGMTAFANPTAGYRAIGLSGASGSLIDLQVGGVRFGRIAAQAVGLTLEAASASSLIVYTGNLERMRVLSNGQIGIGTATPNAVLTVNGPSTYNQNTLFRWTDSTNSTGYLSVLGISGSANGVGIGSDGYIAFSTNQGGANVFNERLRITASGKVGIGLTAPTELVDVAGGNIRVIGGAFVTDTTQGSVTGITGTGVTTDVFTVNTNKVVSHYGLTWKYFTDVSTSPSALLSGFGGIRFFTGGNEAIRITNGGYVGIGKVSPSYKLDVGGDAGISGTLYAGGVRATSAPISDSSDYIATTQWSRNMVASLVSSTKSNLGDSDLLSGVQIRWGRTGVMSGNSEEAVTFDKPFPHACFIACATADSTGNGINADDNFAQVRNVTTTGMVVRRNIGSGNSADGICYWFAIGW